MKNQIRKTKNDINIGIQLLRMIFSFNIVVIHCLNKKYMNKLIYFFCFYGFYNYVPTFFLISFYFSNKLFTSKNINKLKERLLRISIPYIIWPCIFWIKYSFINSMKGIVDSDKYKFLFYQLIIGKSFHPVFWFQFCLLFWSICFIILIFSFKYYNNIIIIITFIILFLNLFGYTNKLFQNYNPIIKRSVREIFYRNIYMTSGFFLGAINILDKSFIIKAKIIIISLFTSFLIEISIFSQRLDCIKTQFIIIIIFFAFSFITSNIIKNSNIIFILKQITSFTGGIYYLHWEIKYRTMNDFFLIKKGDFISCVINYLICYIFCFISYNICKNTRLKYLFI